MVTKSQMILKADYISEEHKSRYTDLQVLQSGGGWYIGTMYWNEEEDDLGGFWEPGSRDSDYFATKKEAQVYLDMLHNMDNDVAVQYMRNHP